MIKYQQLFLPILKKKKKKKPAIILKFKLVRERDRETHARFRTKPTGLDNDSPNELGGRAREGIALPLVFVKIKLINILLQH
jgi:hypothetical protein